MKDIQEVIEECNLSFTEIKKNHEYEFDLVLNREERWLNNLEDKTSRLASDIRSAIDTVISRIKLVDYTFTTADTPKLSMFVRHINSIVRIANRINNFREGTTLDGGRKLNLPDLFNAIKQANNISTFNFPLNKNLNSFIVHLFSVVKHCQEPDRYPIYYRYWKNILGNILGHKDDYDSLCDFYITIEHPKHLSLGSYFGALGILLAKKITENRIIKEEGDKNYNYIKSNILNIHYFDLITGYKRTPEYYLIGSKYGKNNDEDIFPQMEAQHVISVGFSANLDLTEFYLSDEKEIIEYLRDENQEKNAITSLKNFLSIKAGDLVAVKGNGSPKGNTGFLSIMGVCEVMPNNDGEVYKYDPEGLVHTLNVKFVSKEYREFELGGYGSTVHRLSQEKHIDLIFGNVSSKKMDYRNAYLEWLKNQSPENSNKPSSYLAAIDILSEKLTTNVFEEDDLDKLDYLYKDLLKNQADPNGKYFHKEASSYGTSGFYSAAVGAYSNFLKDFVKPPSNENLIDKRVENKFAQAICIIGESGVGKTYRIKKTLEDEGQKALFVIIDSMWQHILFDYSPEERKYRLTKIGEFIQRAHTDPENCYTVVIDECHKNLEIINDVLLQAISLQRNDGVRFFALNSLVDNQFDFLEEVNGNRILPSNLGFLFISSKSDLIEANDDLRNRMEIIELTFEDQLSDNFSIDYLLSKAKKSEDSDYTN